MLAHQITLWCPLEVSVTYCPLGSRSGFCFSLRSLIIAHAEILQMTTHKLLMLKNSTYSHKLKL